MRAQRRVNGDTVGVFGHSEGGWVALRLCARDPSIAKLVLNSCPAVSLINAEIFAMTAAGMSSVDAKAAGGLLRDLARAAGAEDGHEQAKHLIAAAGSEGWYQQLAANGFALDLTGWARICAWGRYDPWQDLNAVMTPTLVVLGADDPLVPVAASARVFETTAAHAGRRQDIAVFPQADHRLRTETNGAFAAGYLDRLSDWILRDTSTGSAARPRARRLGRARFAAACDRFGGPSPRSWPRPVADEVGLRTRSRPARWHQETPGELPLPRRSVRGRRR